VWHLKNLKKDKLSASSNLLEALIRVLMASERTPSPSSSASRKRDGTAKSSNSKMKKLNRSTTMSSTGSPDTSAELTPDLFPTDRRSLWMFSENCQPPVWSA